MTLVNLDFLPHYGSRLQDEDCAADLLRRGKNDFEEGRISRPKAIEMNSLYEHDRTHKLPDGIVSIATHRHCNGSVQSEM